MTLSRIACCVLFGAVFSGPAQAAHFVLANAKVRLELQTRDQQVRIVGLHDLTDRVNRVSRSGKLPLYQLFVTADKALVGASEIVLTSDDADETKVEGTDHRLVVVSRFRRYGLAVQATIDLPPKARLFDFSLSVFHQGEYRLERVRYPGYALDVREVAAVVLPVADGQLLEQPATNLPSGEIRGYSYPGLASAQLLAAYSTQGPGILSYATDASGRFKRLGVGRFNDDLVPLFEHVSAFPPATHWHLPYVIRLGPFNGDWRQAARHYKAWASSQSWASRLLVDRQLPEFLQQPVFFLRVDLSLSDADLQRLPEFVAKWHRRLQVPIVLLLFAWEKHGDWIAPDYFPPRGGRRAFRALTDALRAQGDYSMVFLSGFNFTQEKRHERGRFRAASSDVDRAATHAIVGRSGRSRLGRADDSSGLRLTLCPATSVARQGVLEATAQVAQLGIDVVQLDQVVGGGTPPCYSRHHDHPLGGGDHVFQHVGALLKQMRGNLPVSLEEPNELYLTKVDLFHTREYMERYWPRDQRGAKGIPLFSFLYHEYALGYGGDSAPLVDTGNARDVAVFAQAMNLVTGRLPAGAFWQQFLEPDAIDASQLRFIDNALRCLRGPLGGALLQGRMLDFGFVDAKEEKISFRIGGKRHTLRAPRILSAAFASKDGRVALLFANRTSREVSIALSFPDGVSQAIDPETPDRVIRPGTNYRFGPEEVLLLEGGPR